MPLPLILVAAGYVAAAGAGAAGIGAGAKGVRTVKRARRLSETTATKYRSARRKHLRHRRDCQSTLAEFGVLKGTVMDEDLRQFVTAFSKLKNVRFRPSDWPTEIPVEEVSVGELRKIDLAQWDALKGAIVSSAVGAGAAQATWSSVAAWGTASTGAAIGGAGGLSGAAATNATLAWLGGGSLATGGWGMTAGAALLGGIVVAPVLLVTGFFFNNKAESALAKAESNAEEVEEATAKMEAANRALEAISQRASELHAALQELDQLFKPRVAELERWVRSRTDFRAYSDQRRQAVVLTSAMAKVLVLILNTPLMSSRGNVTRKSGQVLRRAEAQIEHLTAV
jgi:hypothetical protein